MEQNKLESVHALLCDAIAHNFPDWKERSRVSYEIAFMLKKYMIQNYCHISIENNQLVFYPNVQATVEVYDNIKFPITIIEPHEETNDNIIDKIRKLISK